MTTETKYLIKENELRIGNWLKWVGENPEYEQVCIFETYHINENAIELFEPIPLTPEILEKCGFKIGDKYSNGCYYKKELVPHGYFLLFYSYTTKDFIYETIDSNDYGYNTPSVTIRYVHQLQNLYFVLTGKELEVNL